MSDKLTYQQAKNMPFARGWDDGRGRYMWWRFDAVIGGPKNLRAEVTWNDDEHGDWKDCSFFDPQLTIESNYRIGDEYRTYGNVVIDLTQAEAAAIVANPPNALLEQYRDEIDKLADPARHPQPI